MENYFDKQFELRYFEMNKFGVASPTTLLTLIEETAAEHCYSINNSLYDLEKKNIGWILRAGFMKIEHYPRYKEKITIRTWLSGYSTVKGFRENLIYNEQQNLIGRVKGMWVFFDIEKRKPLPIPADFKEKWSFCKEESINQDITKKIKEIDAASHLWEYKVNLYDTDMYKHVNNIRYLQWLFESVPEEIADHYDLYTIDGRFIREAQYGDTIVSLTNEGVEANAFTHTIKVQGTNQVCATANTVWKKSEK